MKKITIKDIPQLMPDFTVDCPNPECKKQIIFKTQDIISCNEVECPYCKCTITIENNFKQTVGELNRLGIFKK